MKKTNDLLLLSWKLDKMRSEKVYLFDIIPDEEITQPAAGSLQNTVSDSTPNSSYRGEYAIWYVSMLYVWYT